MQSTVDFFCGIAFALIAVALVRTVGDWAREYNTIWDENEDLRYRLRQLEEKLSAPAMEAVPA